MTWIEWYDSLNKPTWTPSPSVISTIWMILYPIILVTFGFVFMQAFRRKLPWRVVIPFALNLAANLLFMPFFSGMRSIPLATADIVIVWVTLVWLMIAIGPHYRWVAIAQLPYFIWVSIATTVQILIFATNA
ncbi:MAG: tryptophan-rich sensory protein [Gemmataceae bacterium]|nr:tryptophan-rich sensory protein [Gemmataceae bacterium]